MSLARTALSTCTRQPCRQAARAHPQMVDHQRHVVPALRVRDAGHLRQLLQARPHAARQRQPGIQTLQESALAYQVLAPERALQRLAAYALQRADVRRLKFRPAVYG